MFEQFSNFRTSVKSLRSFRGLSPLARRELKQGMWFLSPWLFGFLVFVLIPILATLFFTFINLKITDGIASTPKWVGFDNYKYLWNDNQAGVNPSTWFKGGTPGALWVTLAFGLIALPVGIFLPLGIAVLMNNKYLKAPMLFRSLFYMPYIVPFVAAVFLWGGMLNSQTGWVNRFLVEVLQMSKDSVPQWANSGAEDWGWTYATFVLMGVWGIGNAMLIMLAGLQNVPTELYDAAKVDGANGWQTFWKVTFPMISPVIFYNLTLSIVGLFQYFLVPLVVNQGNGRPGGFTMFYNLYLYRNFFTFQNMSYGATLAWLLFIIILAVQFFFSGQQNTGSITPANPIRKRSAQMKLTTVQTKDGVNSTSAAIPKVKARLSRLQIKNGVNSTFVTILTVAILTMFLAPFAFMVFTSLKTQDQITIVGAPIWPARPPVFEYNGKQIEVFNVPLAKCAGFDPGSRASGDLAIAKKGQKESVFVDPDDLGRGEFVCTVSWRSLDRAWQFAPTWSNYQEVWDTIDYPRLMWNTTFYAIATTIAVLISCTLVAFGFSRFRFPGRDLLFIVLISTIFLPVAVTVIPTYTFFQRIGWVGTWLPLIVPTFFANAYDVFLLRQYFMTLPRELDEAAMIDGASPLKILWSVIIPQSYPALMAVTVFHIVYAWNDYFGPLIYLSTNRDAWPISIALATFNGIYGQRPQLIQAGALMALIAPLLLFVIAQRFFVQGIVITGVEK